jgi:membrane protease YdiL (CAAX protease family)
VLLVSLALQLPPVDPLPQMLGTLGGMAALWLVAARLGWLRNAGIARLGDWRVWLVALAALIYTVAVYQLAFFGRLGFDLGLLVRSADARSALLREAVVGVVEESLFRGILLYALVRVWGHTRRGRVAGVAVAALVFGLLHALQGLVGRPGPIVGLVILDSLLSGIWLSGLVLQGGSIWPGVVIHALSNFAVVFGSRISPVNEPVVLAYAWVTLGDLLLAFLALWALLRLPRRRPAEETI